ncbi:MAG: hypothetical protein JWO31_2464 [Phycisphaerales bacterium]|nr:hypothetical protein [Phycisphaerales bacterium]
MAYELFLHISGDGPVDPMTRLVADVARGLPAGTDTKSLRFPPPVYLTDEEGEEPVRCRVCGDEYRERFLLPIALHTSGDSNGPILTACRLSCELLARVGGHGDLATQNGELIAAFCHGGFYACTSFSLAERIVKAVPVRGYVEGVE